MPSENSIALLTTGKNKLRNLLRNLLTFNQHLKQRVLTFFDGEISLPIFTIKTIVRFGTRYS